MSSGNRVGNLELVEFLREGERVISSYEMAHRAEELNANCGLREIEWLWRNQHLIPAEWRGLYLLAPGTTRWTTSNNQQYPRLRWRRNCNRWEIDWFVLTKKEGVHQCGHSDRLLREAA